MDNRALMQKAKGLGLFNIAESYDLFKSASEKELKFLDRVFQTEIDMRENKNKQRRLAQSHLPEIKRLEDFDIAFNKTITKSQIERLAGLEWLEEKYNVIFIGNAGTGKTHLAIAIGNLAIERGKKVAFVIFGELIELLKQQERVKSSANRLKYIEESQLLIIDELGYLNITREEGNMFYQNLCKIIKKQSIIITTNLEFSHWGEFLGDEVLATAIVDRITHKCQIISTEGRSYRLAHHQNIFNKKPSKN